MQITDTILTEQGLAPQSKGKILLLACGALAREILALIDQNNWAHLDLKCLPAIYHNFPDKITPAVIDAVHKHRADYEDIFVVYADCGTGGLLKSACDDLGVKMVAGPHCYSFFQGNDDFEQQDEISAFYLTDFLVRQFDAFVWAPLGLGKHPELRDMYFAHYTKLVYQAQIVDEGLEQKARAYAEKLDLAYEYRFTGYGDLQTTLNGVK